MAKATLNLHRESRRGEQGAAMLQAIMVVAACAAVVALQLRGLENESLENNISARAQKARRFGTTVAHTQ